MSKRLRGPFLAFLSLILLCPGAHAQKAATTAPATPAAPAATAAPAPAPGAPGQTNQVDASSHQLAIAIGKMNQNDLDGTEAALTEAIRLNPKNSAAYVLRASLYCQKKQWTQAEDDFKTALTIDPNNLVLKFNLVEVKFMQKQYDLARPGYIELEKNSDMSDIAAYDVFLCDLAGGHADVAKKELDVFNAAGYNPSYYFSNAAWSISQKNYPEAKKWLASAGRIYDPRRSSYYAEGLIYIGYLPLPDDAK